MGAKETVREVAADLRELAGIRLSRKDAERIAEEISVDVEGRDRRKLKYLNKDKEHMRYADFPKRGLFIGSGVIEAAPTLRLPLAQIPGFLGRPRRINSYISDADL